MLIMLISLKLYLCMISDNFPDPILVACNTVVQSFSLLCQPIGRLSVTTRPIVALVADNFLVHRKYGEVQMCLS